MDWNLARTFLAVVDAGSFTGAARASSLPKSSVSRAVARLESELGARLVDRSTRRLSVTAAGRTFYEGARAAVAAFDEAERAVAELSGTPRGTVRFTAPVAIDQVFLADVLQRFLVAHPGIEVLATFSNRRVDLRAEGVDVALRAGRVGDDSLVARRVADDTVGLFASPSYLATHGAPRAPDELPGHAWVLFNPSRTRQSLELQGRAGAARVEVSGRVGADDLGFVHKLVLRGAGIGSLPLRIARADIDAGRLRRVLPEWSLGSGTTFVVTASRQVPRRVALFRDFLVEALRAQLAASDEEVTTDPVGAVPRRKRTPKGRRRARA